MLNRVHITALVVLIASTWGVSLLLHGVRLTTQYLAPFSVSVTVVSLAMLAFDKWLWPWSVWRGWFVKRPDLRGTWQVAFQSNFAQGGDGLAPPTTAYMVVRQTFSSLSMRLHTPESSSRLLGSEIVMNGDGTFEVVGVYLNEPDLSVEHRSPMHRGCLLLRVEGTPPQSLSGRYWTDRTFEEGGTQRNTLGTIRLTNRQAKPAYSYEEAATLYACEAVEAEES